MIFRIRHEREHGTTIRKKYHSAHSTPNTHTNPAPDFIPNLVPKLNTVDLQFELVVNGIDVGSPIGEAFGLFEDHGQAASWDRGSVFASGEDRGDLGIEPLRNAVTDRSRGRRNESLGSASVHEFDEIVVDGDPRWDVA